MAVIRTGAEKKQRYVTATDAEWARILEAAEAVGLQVSEYVVRRCLGPQGSTRSMEFGLTPSVLRRMVLAVLVLEELEERRVKNQGAEELWRTVVAKVDAWIDGQDELG